MNNVWLKDAMECREQLISYRRKLHACAETGFDLPKTSQTITEALTAMGYEPKIIGRCGLVATIGKGEPAVLLRADIDALPIKEQTSLSYACKDGHMHACGHDMHATMLLGAAALLRKHVQQLDGCVKLMFQPAEELLEGAKDMLDHGLLEDTEKCTALMLHVMSDSGLKTGTVIVPNAGVSAPAADFFSITVSGKGCHGAMPHMGVDPINAGAHILLALQTINAREMGANQAHAITITAFNSGATANVIPGEAILQGSVRSYDTKTQQFLRKRIETIAQSTAAAFRASAHVTWLSSCPTLINDVRLVKKAEEMLPSVLGTDRVLSADKLGGAGARSVGSEDFSYISQRVPSLMLAIAAGGEYPLHHPKVVFEEEALPYGAAAYAAFAAQMAGFNCS